MTALTLDYADRDGVAARRRWALSRVIIYAVLTLFAFVYAVPALLVFFNSFRDSAEVARNGSAAESGVRRTGCRSRTWWSCATE